MTTGSLAYGLAALGIFPLDKLLAVAKGIKKGEKVSGTIVDQAKAQYPKQYEQYSKLPTKNLEKAISYHDKQILEHQGYLTDPTKHVPNWNNLSKQHQESLIHHWQQDIKRHEGYKAIANDILKGRK